MKIIKKLIYYSDIRLLIKILITQIKISLFSIKQPHSVITRIPPVNTKIIKSADKNKINRYVNLCVFILRRLGFRYTCLTYSALLCNILRQAGIEARVNFGARKIDCKSRAGINMVGHCWVTAENQELATNYQPIFKHP